MKTILSLLLIFFTVACSSSKEENAYKIARDPSWYPLNFMGKGPSVLGFSDDLISAIAQEEDIGIQQYLSSWSSIEDGLNQRRWDGILSSIPEILSFKDRYSFSEPYLKLGPVLIVLNNSSITSLDEMEGKEVGIQTGSSNVTFLEKYPSIIIKPYDSIAESLEDLLAQKINGVLMPILPAQSYVRDLYQGELKIVTEPLSEEALRLVTLHDEYPELIGAFNSGLKKLKENGQYDQLLKKWKLK